jgi:hypothetical protein
LAAASGESGHGSRRCNLDTSLDRRVEGRSAANRSEGRTIPFIVRILLPFFRGGRRFSVVIILLQFPGSDAVLVLLSAR